MRLVALHLFLFITTISFAQEADIQLKNVSDTILNTKRTLKIADPFNVETAMLKLFPGKIYHYADKNTFISWKCKSCKPAPFLDVNGTEGDQLFPYTEGVATRLLENIDYSDSQGNQYKLLFFNHSNHDEDGLQTGRFSGGLVGVAKFAKNEKIWEMKSFQPAIAAFGSFSQAPKPKLVEIGENQYAFTIWHTNGGPGAPYNGYLYLIAGFDGKYQPLMDVDYYTLSNSPSTNWSSSYTVVTDNNKKFFRDFIIKTTGSYKKAKNTEDDYEVDLPEEFATIAKTKKQFDFVIERRFEFKGKFYKMTGKPIVKISNAK
ncbi:glycoside hydrolase family 68 protein [Flavobacterium sp. KACC 22761]|uniref:glycoside hydrolase family 68 protein n=1 Tax=Flavobacterium sp. KACC 22761 TaxID=3092665 RepID=UPI002A74AD20|nr:glycoside hydrolase family 68 protein [Flavobacterium sp. KACC 22761]WPO77987.1 glycoside hydrolase family 68 protein [Flavobacterium sp. KACC 22761]